MSAAATPAPESKSAAVVRAIMRDPGEGVQEIHRHFCWVRLWLLRECGEHGEDAYHDVLLSLVKTVRRTPVRNVEGMAAYVMQVARRTAIKYWKDQASARIRGRGDMRESMTMLQESSSAADEVWHPADPHPDPEEACLRKEQMRVAALAIRKIPETDRRILTLFYLSGLRQEEIQALMGLTTTQFRLKKSRAKQRLAREYAGLLKRKINRGAG